MMLYKCHVCQGMCDPGELENGVCFDCRQEMAEKEARRSLAARVELNRMIRARQAAAAGQANGNGGIM